MPVDVSASESDVRIDLDAVRSERPVVANDALSCRYKTRVPLTVPSRSWLGMPRTRRLGKVPDQHAASLRVLSSPDTWSGHGAAGARAASRSGLSL
jgi:hypothetical protein